MVSWCFLYMSNFAATLKTGKNFAWHFGVSLLDLKWAFDDIAHLFSSKLWKKVLWQLMVKIVTCEKRPEFLWFLFSHKHFQRDSARLCVRVGACVCVCVCVCVFSCTAVFPQFLLTPLWATRNLAGKTLRAKTARLITRVLGRARRNRDGLMESCTCHRGGPPPQS